MNKRAGLIALLLTICVSPALFAGQETIVSAAFGGLFPAGTTFGGVPVQALDAGFGLEIEDGQALGEFCVVLLGTSLLGVEQTILIEGKATAGAQTAANIATFSGTVTVNMGDGTVAALNVPFTATVSTNAEDQGSLGLVIGGTTLPDATVDAGSMTISVPPIVTPVIP